MVLGRLGRPAESLELLDADLRGRTRSGRPLNLKAATLGRLGDFEQALDIYEQVLARAPNQPRVLDELRPHAEDGRASSTKASPPIARRSPSIRRSAKSWWSLANLKTVRFADEDVAAMEQALSPRRTSRTTTASTSISRWARRCTMLGRSDEAFGHYAAGNALRRKYHPLQCRASGAARSTEHRAVHRRHSSPSAPAGSDAPDPIFILGMPRAGSTLVEQILSSHSLVEGTSELPDMPALARGAAATIPSLASTWPPSERREAGRGISERTRVQRQTDRARSSSTSCRTIGCRAVHPPDPAERENRRCAAASARLLLLQLQAAFCARPGLQLRLDDIGRYYADYVRLMAHVDHVLPGRVHRVIYERMVDDTEAEIRALLDYCGLPFEPACLASTRTSAPCAPRAPNRCAGRSTATRPSDGGPTKPGSAR